ncbi:MAG: triose-phosphate isomerase [Spirochaetota bacterium]
MRETIIAGNWKMNLGLTQAKELAEGLRDGIAKVLPENTKAIVFPSDLHIPAVTQILKDAPVSVGIQNIYPSDLAAFTGESCIAQIQDFALQYVLIGHSERRQFLGEDNTFLNKKLHFCLEKGCIPVFCVGETLEEREAGNTDSVIQKQITEGLQGLDANKLTTTILAYEPVWAIGTGKVATPEQAQEVHKTARNLLEETYGQSLAEKMPILYGGSVKPGNVKALLGQADIDGALVGGASQKSESFLALF